MESIPDCIRFHTKQQKQAFCLLADRSSLFHVSEPVIRLTPARNLLAYPDMSTLLSAFSVRRFAHIAKI